MEIQLNRGHDTGESTIGIMSVGKDFYPTLEDTYREVKVKGITRIPSGRYQIKYRKVMSGKTTHYRDLYDWFTWHLWLQDVPNFQYVYIHVGNEARNTDGCILVASTLDRNKKDYIGNSRPAYKDFYKTISQALNDGEEVWITIQDN